MSYLFDDFFYPERLLLRDNFFFPERRLLRNWFDDEPRRMTRRRISDEHAEPRQQQALARPDEVMQCVPSFEFQAEKDAAVVRAVTPGLSKEDLNVKIEGRNLIISGGTKKEETGEGYSRRSYQNFTRSWTLPPELDVDGVTADYKDGVLELRVPRVEQPGMVSKTVAIGDKTAAPTPQVEASKQGNADVIMDETAKVASKPIANPAANQQQQQNVPIA